MNDDNVSSLEKTALDLIRFKKNCSCFFKQKEIDYY